MASNLGLTWRRNYLSGAKAPFKFPIKLQAGATQAIKSGEILDLSNLNAVAPLAADKAMAGIIAIADAEIRSGDLAGYHMVVVPRPGDIFEYALAAAGASATSTALFWSDSQTLTITAGANIIGYTFDDSIIPMTGFQSVNPSYDAGTTLRTTNKTLMIFKLAASYWAALNP